MPKGVYTRHLPPLADRFWERVDKNGPIPEHCPELGPCWLWLGQANDSGYGVFWLDGRKVRAHRLAYKLNRGHYPPKGCALHHCDVRRCVRDSHLFDGTRGDNLIDAIAKGRHRAPTNPPSGSRHWTAKLTEAVIPEIRVRLSRGESYNSIGRIYGVSSGTIRDLAIGKTWARV